MNGRLKREASCKTGVARHHQFRQRRGMRAGAVVGALALLTVACGNDGGDDEGGGSPDGDGSVTLTFANWASAEDATRPGFQETIDQFESEDPNITVESEGISFSDIAQQMVQRVQAGNPPDVAQLAGNDTFAVAATGALAPMGDLLSEEARSAVSQANLEAGTHEGELIAFPWTDSPQGFWYNKKLMEQAGLDPEQPPATIDELMDALAAINEEFPDITPLGLDITNRPFGLGANWAWIATFGAEPFSGTEVNADSPEMREYLSWMQEMAQNGYITPGNRIGDFRPLAAQDQVAFIWDQDVLQGVIQDTNGMSDEEFFQTWGVTTLPAGPSGETYSVNQGHQLVIFNESENKDAAAKLVEYLSTSEESIITYTMDSALTLPPLENPTGEVAERMDTPVRQSFLNDINPTFTTPPYGQAFSQGYGPVMAGVEQVVTSDADPAEVASQMQQQLEAAITQE